MRIQAIQNYYRTNNTYSNKTKNDNSNVSFIQNKNVTMPNSLGSGINYNPATPISFTSLQNTAKTLASQIPLDDRLASIFQISKFGDVIITSKDLKTAQKALKDTASNFDHIIRRFFFVPENLEDGTLIFKKNPNDELEIINPNNFNIEMFDVEGHKYKLEPDDTFYASTGDSLVVKNKIVTIKEKAKTDLSNFRKMFSSAFDVSDNVTETIKKQNLKSILSLSKSEKAKNRELSFKDVGGQDSVIKELKKGILYPIKYPEAYENANVSHGFIMYGPPGTGKTLIAQALANETNADFVKLNGLEMESKWVGESEENWRKLFETAKENQPSIIFIDEFDAVAKKRGGADVYGDKVVNQLLTLMSDVEKDGDEIYVIAATNKIDMLDNAITRSGRFGKHIEVKAPDTVDGIEKILEIHTRNKQLSKDLDKLQLSQELLNINATGADIAHIVNSANENALERSGIYEKMEAGTFEKSDIDKLEITTEDFSKAINSFKEKSHKNRNPIGFNKQK